MYKKFIILLLSYIVSIKICLSQTNKPILHGKHWIITGKPLGATSGAMIFSKEVMQLMQHVQWLLQLLQCGMF